MTFELVVDYRAHSKETMFLVKGWGMRDVRGVYMSSHQAVIGIPGHMLSTKHDTSITLQFSVSNRSAFAGIYVKATHNNVNSGTIIGRNSSAECELIISPQKQEDLITIFIENFIPINNSQFQKFNVVDIVSIDELRLKRVIFIEDSINSDGFEI